MRDGAKFVFVCECCAVDLSTPGGWAQGTLIFSIADANLVHFTCPVHSDL